MRRKPKHGKARRCRRSRRTPSRPRPILRKTAIRTAAVTETENNSGTGGTASNGSNSGDGSGDNSGDGGNSGNSSGRQLRRRPVKRSPITVATTVGGRQDTHSLTATDASRNGNRQSNRKKHCGGKRIPSLPPQCVSASSNHRIAMADAPGRSVVCHIAIFIAAILLMQS